MGETSLLTPPYQWQSSLWTSFIALIEQDRLPHAILMASPKGVGADEFALAMARYLFCHAPLNGLVCGRCKGCVLSQRNQHPDLLLIQREEKAKQIKVDQIRECSDFVNMTAQQGGFKAVVIREAELMNINAANALLKNLEEPAGQTLMVLVSESSSRILPTIRSRCRQWDAPKPKRLEALAWLKDQDVDDAEGLLDSARGAPLLAKNWYENSHLENREKILHALLDAVDQRITPMDLAKLWLEFDMLSIVEILMACSEEFLAAQYKPSNQSKVLVELASRFTQNSHQRLFEFRDKLLVKKAQLLSGSNLNVQMFAEDLSLDWIRVTQGSSKSSNQPRRSAPRISI